MTTLYPETNAEVIDKALYCLKHGETESVENWLDLLRERLTTDNIRADALTKAVTHTIDTIGRQLDLIAERAPGNILDKVPVVRSLTAHKKRLEKALAAVEQHEAAPAELDWRVRERRAPDGTLIDCFVEAPTEGDMPYALEVPGDDYTGYGGIDRKYEHCKLIVGLVNANKHPESSAPLEGAGNGAEGAKPVAWFIDWPDEPDLGHYFGEEPCDGARNRALGFIDRAPRAGAVPERIYQYAQPGSIEFDGAEAYEQYLNEHVKESVTMPPVKGVSIDGGYVIVTPAGGRDNAPAIKAAILALAGTEQTAFPTSWKAMPATLTQAMRMAMAKAASEYWKCTGRNSPDVIYEAAISSAPQPSSACASCGEHKNTPLRIDWMGGYVCLTCIDRELESRAPRTEMAGAVPEGWKVVPIKITAAMIEAGLAGHYGKRRARMSGGAAGIVMTVDGKDWSGADAMRRIWKGALDATPQPPSADAAAAPIYAYEWDCAPGVVHRDFEYCSYNGRYPDRTLMLYTAPPAQVATRQRLTDEQKGAVRWAISNVERHGYESGSVYDTYAKAFRALLTDQQPEPRAEVMMLTDALRRIDICNTACGELMRDIAHNALVMASFNSGDDRNEFLRACQDFDEDGETDVNYALLMKWAITGLLECDHFTITKKGRAVIDAARAGEGQ